MAIGEKPGRRLIRSSLSSDHIAGDRPGSPAEADKGGLRRESPFDAINRLKHRVQMGQGKLAKTFYGLRCRQSVKSRAFSDLE